MSEIYGLKLSAHTIFQFHTGSRRRLLTFLPQIFDEASICAERAFLSITMMALHFYLTYALSLACSSYTKCALLLYTQVRPRNIFNALFLIFPSSLISHSALRQHDSSSGFDISSRARLSRWQNALILRFSSRMPAHTRAALGPIYEMPPSTFFISLMRQMGWAPICQI